MQKIIKPKTIALSAKREIKSQQRPITGIKKIKDLWDNLFTLEHLREIYLNKIRIDKTGMLKKAVGLDFVTHKKFEEDLDENLKVIARKVKNGTYRFTRYKLILINKGLGKPPREIRIATIRDRITQAVMGEFARKVFGAQCEIPNGRNIIKDIANERKNFSGYSKSDISQFFKNINHELLKQKLEKKFQDQYIVDLFMKAVSTESYSNEFSVPKFDGFEWERKGVPEGLSFSGFIANMFLEDIDLKYQEIPDIRYYRFVDDILILCSAEDSERYSSMLSNDFGKLRLSINTDKASDVSKAMTFDYLGYVFDGDKITIRQKSLAKIENRLADIIKNEAKRRRKLTEKSEQLNIETDILALLDIEEKPFNETLNNAITGFKIDKAYFSWLNYYSLINDYTLMGKLDALVQNLLARYGIDDIKPKKFLKTLLECQHNPNSTYIPDYTYVRFIRIQDGDENININVSSNLAKQVAKQIGWNRDSGNISPTAARRNFNEHFNAAIKLAISEGFSFEKRKSKYFINMKEFKKCVQKAITKLLSDSNEL